MTPGPVAAGERARCTVNNDLTQEELSEKLGMHVNYVSRVERYQNGVSFPVLYELARTFKIKVRD